MTRRRQDERAIKREKRKQSHRESARRSRLRKLAECEELQARVDLLRNETRMLREELHRLAEECKQVSSENKSIMEELTHLRGTNATSSLLGINHDAALFYAIGEEDNHGQDTYTENKSLLQIGSECHSIYNGKHDFNIRTRKLASFNS